LRQVDLGPTALVGSLRVLSLLCTTIAAILNGHLSRYFQRLQITTTALQRRTGAAWSDEVGCRVDPNPPTSVQRAATAESLFNVFLAALTCVSPNWS